MTLDELPLRLDPELASHFVANAGERGGPRAIERATLRTRSRAARDLLAYAATSGRFGSEELLATIRRARSAPGGRAVPTLDLEWAMSLARVIGMQNLDDGDLNDAVLLLTELHRQYGRRMFTPLAQQTAIERLWQAGEKRLLSRWLPYLRRAPRGMRRFLLTDLVNPFAMAAGTPKRRIAQLLWKRRVDALFSAHGIEPVSVAEGGATPFDGLSCRVEDSVSEGPKVTVIMPVFRPGPELLTSVRSICQQTWRNLEILIMDDASPPGHEQVLEACAALDERIQVHRMDENGGTYLARNAALDLATGEFVTVQDADDWSHPRRIELQAKALLADPTTPATRSFCLRVSEDLIFQRPGYSVSQENASSLMFRREQALATIGYFDRSRKSADTEFRRRLELATGAVTTDLEAPLAFVRMASGSLSRADFTPGWHHPSRYIYRGAYERWHASLLNGGDPYLARFQKVRPFAVPQRFQIDQRVLADIPPHYDVVLLSDWRHLGPAQQALVEAIDALTANGYRVGVSHRESFLNLARRRLPLHPRILDLINAGTVDFVALDQKSTVSLLVVRSPEVLQFAPATASTLDIDRVLVVADQPPQGDDESPRRYTPAVCDAAARTVFSAEPLWATDSGAMRTMLVEDLPAERVLIAEAPTSGGDPLLTTVTDLIGPPRRLPDGAVPDEPRGTTAAAPGEQARPEWSPVDEPAERAALSVVLLATETVAPRLGETLQAVHTDPLLIGVPLTVVYDSAAEDCVAEAALQHPSVRFVAADGESGTGLARTACSLLADTTAAYISITNLPRVRDVGTWSRALRTEVERLTELGLDAPVPLLAWTRHSSQQVVAAYLADVLGTGAVEAGPFADYLGMIALRSARPRIEAIDPLRGEIDVLVWLAAKLSPDMPRPPWRYRVTLTHRREPMAISPSVAPALRVDNRGNDVWENLPARIPLQDIDDGNYVFTIEVDTEVEALRSRRRLLPAKGVLLEARTVTMPSGSSASGSIRYLAHATASGNMTFLALQNGSGWTARVRWAASMARKDLSALLRWRKHRRMSLLRMLRLLTRPVFAGRRIWLIGERSDTAQDNGLHLFRHIRQHHPQRHVYYVIDPMSPHRDRVAHLGNVIDHSSLRHQLLMLHAEVLANAYSIRYLTPASWGQKNYVQHMAWRVGALRIYLKHGVHLNQNAVKRGLSGYDMFLTVMARESEALRAVSGYDQEIREIGMPRYDGLVPTPSSRTILFMPTWRQYLVPRLSGRPNPGQIAFEGSAYERFISGFLQSPRLHRMLEKHDFRLTFLPHYNMASHFESGLADAERIGVADTNETSFQDLLRTCDAFITDYSSVHFDVAYLGTPVIYARFDEQDYEAGHASASWFDYERDGYGPVVRDVQEALDALERVLDRGCTVEDVYAARVAESFTYRDRNNSARVVEAIDELSAGR